MAAKAAASASQQFFIENARAVSEEMLSSVRDSVAAFVSKHSGAGRRVAVVTSGGTTVPLEHKTVRFIDNFSTGTRGALCCENLIRKDYAVIFIHRRGSVFPFVVDTCTALRNDPLGLVTRASSALNSFEVSLRKAELAADRLLSVPFTTLFEYLYLLRDVHCILRHTGPNAMTILAAAVADFYIPCNEMATEKIQSASECFYFVLLSILSLFFTLTHSFHNVFYLSTYNFTGAEAGLTLTLRNTPKLLKDLCSRWCPRAMVVSFKLETNANILIAKAAGAIFKYGVDVVCANVLGKHREAVTLVSAEEDPTQVKVKTEGPIRGDEECRVEVSGVCTEIVGLDNSRHSSIEQPLVEALQSLHSKYIQTAELENL